MNDQIFVSPPKPTLAAFSPFPLAITWWHPTLCAPVMDWTNGNSGPVVEWTFKEEAPDADRI
jgi:hypothetical protein